MVKGITVKNNIKKLLLNLEFRPKLRDFKSFFFLLYLLTPA